MRREQWGSHGFTMEGTLYPAGRRGQGGDRAATKPGRPIRAKVCTDPCAELSVTELPWPGGAGTEEASEGDRSRAGAQERSNSEQSDQITRGQHFQESHSQTPFFKERDKSDPSSILHRNKALSDLLSHLCRQPD